MTTVSPFARSSGFDEPLLGGREQTVSDCSRYVAVRNICTHRLRVLSDRGDVQRAGELPGDRGAQSPDTRCVTRLCISAAVPGSLTRGAVGWLGGRLWPEDVHRLRDRVQGA